MKILEVKIVLGTGSEKDQWVIKPQFQLQDDKAKKILDVYKGDSYIYIASLKDVTEAVHAQVKRGMEQDKKLSAKQKEIK